MLGWLREIQVEVISLRESIDGDSDTGRAMLHLGIVFAEMERRRAHERTLVGLERVKATADGWICRERTREAAVGHLGGKRVQSRGGGFGLMADWLTIRGKSRDSPWRGREQWWRGRQWMWPWGKCPGSAGIR